MADDTTGGEPGATATITADTKPWEQALERAADRAKAWGGKVEATVAGVSKGFEKLASLAGKAGEWSTKGFDKLGGLSDQLKAAEEAGAEATGQAIGKKIGNAIGGLSIAGFKLGPLADIIGEELGAKIGKGLGAIDFDAMMGKLREGTNEWAARFGDLSVNFKDLAKGLKESGADIGTTWDNLKRDGSGTFTQIGDIFKKLQDDLSFDKLADMNFDQVLARIGQAGSESWDKFTDFAGRSFIRIEQMIDRTWKRLQEPVARIADWAQGLLVEFGVLEKGVASWGDAIRGVEGVGRKVFESLAYGFGYVEGIGKKVFGAIGFAFTEIIGNTLKDVLQKIRFALSSAFAFPGAREWAKGVGLNVDGILAGLDKAVNAVEKRQDQFKRSTFKWLNIDPEKEAEAALNKFRGKRDQWQGEAMFQDLLFAGQRMAERLRAGFLDKWNAFFGAGVPDTGKDGGVAGALTGGYEPVKAVLTGSQEAANIYARSVASTGGQQVAALNRAAKAAEEQKKELERIRKEQEKANRHLEKIAVLMEDAPRLEAA